MRRLFGESAEGPVTLLSVHRALLSKSRALLRVYRALFERMKDYFECLQGTFEHVQGTFVCTAILCASRALLAHVTQCTWSLVKTMHKKRIYA